jgi:hypothetical protein
MAEKKSIYEEAMLDVKKIQEALNANTKEILRSVAREEIDGVVKESLMEDDYEEETVSDEAGEESSLEGGEESGEDLDVPEAGEEASDEFGGEAEIQASDEVGPEDQDLGMDADAFGEDELDLTAASDDAIIAIYKKLSGDDEIEVVGDDVHLNISEPGEYIIKGAAAGVGGGATEPDMDDLGGEAGEAGETDDWEEVGGEESGEEVAGGDDDLDYEIAMDDESDDEEDESMMAEAKKAKDTSTKPTWAFDKKGNKKDVSEPMTADQIKKLKESEEEDESVAEAEEEDEDIVKEAIPVGLAQSKRLPGKVDIGQPRGAGAHDLKKESVSQLEDKYRTTLKESAQLKVENEEFRKALKKFRNMLVETVVFNSNLSYVTKLFMEHSTTKDEKKKIIQRFDEEVTNLKESKKLYKSIVTELTDKKSITEAVETKIIKEVATGSSKLNEATAYVDQSTQRIKDLISRVENR